MIATIDNRFQIDLSKPIDLSIPLTNSPDNPLAWYLDAPKIEPVRMGEWVGKVADGASTNFNNIEFNPHGHGTHTECLGHITKNFYSINRCLKKFFFEAQLISIEPQPTNGDLVISKNSIEKALRNKHPEALIIRTLPNKSSKKNQKYSNTNPPYLSEEAAIFIREICVQHLLVDLPSLDKDKDNGKLLTHKAFWNVTNTTNLNSDARMQCTITELIFVDNSVFDGAYLLNLQIASFENDASPSKPVLYQMQHI